MALCGGKLKRYLGPNVYPEAPDGGWGWAVAVAFFLVEAFTYGIIKSFGIFLNNLMEDFGETNNRVSWIVSICVFVMTFFGPVSSIMTNRFGFQLVVMLGGFLICSGTVATSFTSSINQMYITYGLVAGFGYCLTFLPTVTILSHYFHHRRSLVTAVASTGESISMFALAPAFSALRDRIGWRHTMAAMGALQSLIIICGALLRPIIITPGAAQRTEKDKLSSKELEVISTQEKAQSTNTEEPLRNGTSTERTTSYNMDSEINTIKETDCSTPEENTLLHTETNAKTEHEPAEESEAEGKLSEVKTNGDSGHQGMLAEENKPDGDKQPAKKAKLLDFSILTDCAFILYSLFGLFATLGFFAPQLYIIELSVSRGVERDRAAYMLSIMAVSEIFGRFSIGWVLTRKPLKKKKLLVLLVCVIIMALDLVGFTFVTEFYGLAVCSCVYGFFMGTLACTHIPMLAEDDVVGIERMSSAAGVYVFIQSFAGLAGPPLGGVLVDVTQNYGSAFYSCAAGMIISAIFLGLVKPAKIGLLCGKRSSKHPEYAQKHDTDFGKHINGQKVDQRTNCENDCDKQEGNNQLSATTDAEEVIRFA